MTKKGIEILLFKLYNEKRKKKKKRKIITGVYFFWFICNTHLNNLFTLSVYQTN